MCPISAGPAGEKIVRGLEQRADAQQFRVGPEAADELEPDRQPVATKTAGQTDRGVAGHVERHGPGEPVRPDAVEMRPVDLDSAEQVLVDR